MSEATGQEARTIHRMLEYGGDETTFQRNSDNPLDCGTLIIDEMSMVDLFLMRAVLRALTAGTRLVMVGDADQLPSIGAGNVLRDIMAGAVCPVVRLTVIFRQAQQSMIVLGAHSINRGEMPKVNARDSDFFMQRVGTGAQAAQTILELLNHRLPAYLTVDALRDIQVLSPTKKGEAGVWRLNAMLQEALNPPLKGKPEFKHGDTTFRLGDKVMQTKNNYQIEWARDEEEGQGIFNGDMGVIAELDAEERVLTVRFDDDREVVYEDAALDELELCYCISVHKSQGSEFPVVVMPVVPAPRMLMTRNLLYTAVTRARKFVMLVGRDDALKTMIENDHIDKRYSALAVRLRGMCNLAGRT